MECLRYIKFWHLWLKQEDKLIEWKTKGKAKALRINATYSRREPQFFWEKTGAIRLVLVGLTTGWPADKMRVEIKIFKILYKLNYSDCYFF